MRILFFLLDFCHIILIESGIASLSYLSTLNLDSCPEKFIYIYEDFLIHEKVIFIALVLSLV